MSTPPFPALWQKLTQQVRVFLLALGFLTRLAPAMVATRQEMSASCTYYPFAGAVLGALLLLPFSLHLFAGQIWVQAWLYVLLSAWLTRALHLDGLADVLDALGSGKTGEAFHAILKDSRMGAFGAVGVTLALAGQIILVAACIQAGHFGALFFAPLFGRCLPMVLAATTQPHPKASLGAILSAAPKAQALFIAAITATIAGSLCIGPRALLTTLILAGLCLFALSRIARKEGGYNGDFLGCSIITGEVVVLLAVLL